MILLQMKILNDYLIAEVYKLPFKKKINKTLDKDIDKICKKNELYEDLILKDIDKKIRTNNSLENFNRIFKNLLSKKSNIELVIYVDNLIEITQDVKEFYISQINKKSKKISNY